MRTPADVDVSADRIKRATRSEWGEFQDLNEVKSE